MNIWPLHQVELLLDASTIFVILCPRVRQISTPSSIIPKLQISPLLGPWTIIHVFCFVEFSITFISPSSTYICAHPQDIFSKITPSFFLFHLISVLDFTIFFGRSVHSLHFSTLFLSFLQSSLCIKFPCHPLSLQNVTMLDHTFYIGDSLSFQDINFFGS